MSTFRFQRFSVRQDRCAMKVGTDSVVLGAWAQWPTARRILDIGTGTGVLALMAAQRFPQAVVHGVEIDEAAAAQAEENIAASVWVSRMRVYRMDVRRMRTSEPYDLILCNPPYYAGEMASVHSNLRVAKHGDGLRLAELARSIHGLLAEAGACCCIIPLQREQEFLAACAPYGLFLDRRCLLYYLLGRPPKRVLLRIGRQHCELVQEELTVETAVGHYTPSYRALLKDLLLFFPGDQDKPVTATSH
jgi:tRNA1Val (adenine37-N6)-methyltransferase